LSPSPTLPTRSSAPSESAIPLKLAQGILCGSWALAFPFEWARQIVDDYELSPVPKSPVWMLGASNIDGNILPVVDLTVYLGSSAIQANTTKRLLIGGMQGADADQAIALAFTGLPQQLSYEPRALTYSSALPERLRLLCTGVASNAAGHDFLEISAQQLLSALSDELSYL
jgi:chemotaxis signal transduction protein